MDEADAAYQAVRDSSVDMQRIAAAIGLKEANVGKVKAHLFDTPHLLDRYEHLAVPAVMCRFDSDLRNSYAWRRLEIGAFTAADLQLLAHEAAEAWYLRRHGPGYAAAHGAAQRRFASPFATLEG